MQTDIQTVPSEYERRPRRRSRLPYVLLVCTWLLLIAGGAAGAVWYVDQLRQQMTADLERQTADQIAAMQTDYQTRIAQLEADYKQELEQLEGKVDALNQLLTFTKDNASSRTDNSNELYTQLSEVKKQLDELKKKLDVLK